jgi:CBS-domain-containing membrane protein
MIRDHYSPLAQSRLDAGVGHYLPDTQSLAPVGGDSPAIEVMTDLRRIPSALISPGDTLEAANQLMILRGVRMLLVSDPQRRMIGLLTATDLLGEKPIQIVQGRGIRYSDVAVGDVMVPLDRIDAMDIGDVHGAAVGHVVATLKQCGRQHAVVVETDAAGHRWIRGVFSASQIARQLGIPIQIIEIARTFHEIEAALAR